jgi:hypothetical protein
MLRMMSAVEGEPDLIAWSPTAKTACSWRGIITSIEAAFSGTRQRPRTDPQCNQFKKLRRASMFACIQHRRERSKILKARSASIFGANADSVLVLASPMSYSDRGMLLAQPALRFRLPAMFAFKENAEAGGLMSCSADILDLYRRSAVYIDKILKGGQAQPICPLNKHQNTNSLSI